MCWPAKQALVHPRQRNAVFPPGSDCQSTVKENENPFTCPINRPIKLTRDGRSPRALLVGEEINSHMFNAHAVRQEGAGMK